MEKYKCHHKYIYEYKIIIISNTLQKLQGAANLVQFMNRQICKNKEKVCDKVITSYHFQQSLQNYLDIIYFLSKQKHPNIVSILDVDQVEEDSQIKIIIYMEQCKNGNL
ncbi:hypothetical protein pb186bvf_015740 [Paramecium bursaria]